MRVPPEATHTADLTESRERHAALWKLYYRSSSSVKLGLLSRVEIIVHVYFGRTLDEEAYQSNSRTRLSLQRKAEKEKLLKQQQQQHNHSNVAFPTVQLVTCGSSRCGLGYGKIFTKQKIKSLQSVLPTFPVEDILGGPRRGPGRT